MLMLGVPSKLVDYCKFFNEECSSSVYIDGFLSAIFTLISGIWQGCPLSSILFAFATVGLYYWAQEMNLGMKMIISRWIFDMFADDLSAYINSLMDLELWTVGFKEWGE